MEQLLNRMRLRGKLAFILILGFFLPMTILVALTVSRIQSGSREVRLQEMRRIMEHASDQMDALFSQAVMLSLDVVTDTSLNQLLDAEYASPYDYLIAYQEGIQTKLDVNPVYSAVSRMMVYTDNPTVISGKSVSSVRNIDAPFSEPAESVGLWSGTNRDLSLLVSAGGGTDFTDANICLIRKMNYTQSDQNYRRVLRVAMNLPVLADTLTNPAPFETIMLLDAMNRVLVSSGSVTSRGSSFQEYRPEEITKRRKVMEHTLAVCPSLRIVGVYPESALTMEYSRILPQYLVISLLLIALGLILAALVARNITRRLQLIGRHTQGIAKGHFGGLDESKMGDDEVGVLARDIDQMSRQLETYIQKEYLNELQHAQLQREKATAELHALQSQVDPHFMFNALEAIRLKARTRGETETARMITYMSRMFRRLLEWHDDLIPLREELAFIHEFLAIQKYRYDHAFSFEVYAEEDLLESYIPKMLIQPLVENACVHGLSPESGTQNAGLFISREGENMRVTVSDHGEGMSEERLSEVRQLLRDGNNSMHSVGLNNVVARCRLYFGSAASMDVNRGENGGTVFTLVVPLRWRKEDFHVSGADCG